MNRILSLSSLVVISIIFLVLQSTLLSPKNLGALSPDLNLIIIIILALLIGVKGGSVLALGNGYMLDVLSGNLIGVNTLSRLSVFAVIRGSKENVYYHRIPALSLAIFLSTILSWGFIWVVFKINPEIGFGISFKDIIKQGIVNTLVGLPLFLVIKTFHERVQK